MKKKTVNMMKGLGVAMAVGSMVAGTVATMNSNSAKTQKTMKKAVNSVANFVDDVAAGQKKRPLVKMTKGLFVIKISRWRDRQRRTQHRSCVPQPLQSGRGQGSYTDGDRSGWGSLQSACGWQQS